MADTTPQTSQETSPPKKRGPGRPPKPKPLEPEEPKPKRPKGRPKGSKNKPPQALTPSKSARSRALRKRAEEVVGKSQKPGNSEEAQGGTSKQGEQSK